MNHLGIAKSTAPLVAGNPGDIVYCLRRVFGGSFPPKSRLLVLCHCLALGGVSRAMLIDSLAALF
ncbi:MAG: hypothetical protein HC764_21440 [Pleurocapsa sp. CRU_1_2]|nr:hypothetical protein [Pleurocapsa sp. CRU_1_2]